MMEISPQSKILIYGYGVEGQSTALFFEKQNIPFTIYDEFKEDYKEKPNLAAFDIIVVSAGINPDQKIPSEFRHRCTSNCALFFHFLSTKNKAKIIGITGTKGKSMTTKLTHETLLKAGKKTEIAGNFGKGLLDLSDKIEELDYLVIELSSYQLASLDTSPPYALCTNLYEDHLDWHGSKTHYHQSKSHLWKYQDKTGKLFVPSHQKDNTLFKTPGEMVVCDPVKEDLFPSSSIWRATHYRENFGLVKALMKTLKVKNKDFETACMELEGLPHRLDYLGTFKGIDFYDDAISTNPRSTLAAVKFFGPHLGTLLIGGKDRDQNFQIMFAEINQVCPDLHVIILPSETQSTIKQSLCSMSYTKTKSMAEAVQTAFEKTPQGKACILSPAAPSFDHYQNYMEKGKDFEKCIQESVQ